MFYIKFISYDNITIFENFIITHSTVRLKKPYGDEGIAGFATNIEH